MILPWSTGGLESGMLGELTTAGATPPTLGSKSPTLVL